MSHNLLPVAAGSDIILFIVFSDSQVTSKTCATTPSSSLSSSSALVLQSVLHHQDAGKRDLQFSANPPPLMTLRISGSSAPRWTRGLITTIMFVPLSLRRALSGELSPVISQLFFSFARELLGSSGGPRRGPTESRLVGRCRY